jgi:Anti-sigma-K factor rskA
VAAVVLVGVIGAVGVAKARNTVPGQRLELAAGEFAPTSTGLAHIDEQANGVRIVLDVSGLEPAPPGTFYAAWVVREEPKNRVGVGTFHLRGGDGRIELWSGVSMRDYPILSVTLQPENDPTGPGQPVMKGRLGS